MTDDDHHDLPHLPLHDSEGWALLVP